MNETGLSIDEAVASVVEEIHIQSCSFDCAAEALLSKVRPDEVPVVMEYINALRSSVTGSITWSYVCPSRAPTPLLWFSSAHTRDRLENKRYGMKQHVQADGSIAIPL